MFNLNQAQDFFFKNYSNQEQKLKINKKLHDLFFDEFLDLKANGSNPRDHIFNEAMTKAEKKLSAELEKEFEEKIEKICVEAKMIDSFIGTLVTKFLLYIRDCDFIFDAVSIDNEIRDEIKGQLYKEGIITLEGDLVDESNRL